MYRVTIERITTYVFELEGGTAQEAEDNAVELAESSAMERACDGREPISEHTGESQVCSVENLEEYPYSKRRRSGKAS